MARLHQLAITPEAEVQDFEDFFDGRDFPVNEGHYTTFAYRGEADEVRLRHWIYGLPSSLPLTRVGDSDLWLLVQELPPGSRIEYKFEVVNDRRRRLVHDSLNPNRAHDPYGSNSVLHARGYERPEWVEPDPEARPGEMARVSLESKAFGEEREFLAYLPPRMRPTQRYPLLVVHDGPDYLRFSQLRVVLDNLIYRQEVAPLVAVLIASSDRLVEYAADSRHARFVADELVPAVEELYPIDPRPAARGLMGASFGAVAALASAWANPGRFGRLLLQSGSFAFTDIGPSRRGEVFDPVVAFMNHFRARPGRPSERIYMSCGQYESLIYENRSLVPLLQETGMAVRYSEARDGHNWENWRDSLREGLSFLFPGPLWMVYE